MSKDRMQSSRFELKYAVTERKAREIRNYVGSFLQLDPYGAGKPDYSYPVHSLYLDSDRMQTYWDTINGTKNRFKLRLRYYSDEPGAPVFVEVKRRVNSTIQKERAGVTREAARMILNGQFPPASMMLQREPKHILALETFCRYVQGMQAKPRLHINYLREAYLPPEDNSARVTIDRQVQFEPDPAASLSTTMKNPSLVWAGTVILELKFTDRYPNWFRHLVSTFDLTQCGAAKYVDGVSVQTGSPVTRRRQRPLALDPGAPPGTRECRPGHRLDSQGKLCPQWVPVANSSQEGTAQEGFGTL